MLARQGADENLRRLLAAQRKPAAADLQKAGPTALQHEQAATHSYAQLGQTTDPGRFALNFGNISPFARTQQFEGEKSIQSHGKHLWQSEGVSALLVETESQSKV
jgi:hypothetical protein